MDFHPGWEFLPRSSACLTDGFDGSEAVRVAGIGHALQAVNAAVQAEGIGHYVQLSAAD